MSNIQSLVRCGWANLANPVYVKYHDDEWGIPVHDDRKLFEMLILEGAQAGLSWETILNKRDNYRKAFDNFDFYKVAKYDQKKIDELLQNSGIIRNKLKINAAINNAQKYIEIINEFGSFDKYLWGYVDNQQVKNKFKSLKEVPTQVELSDKISNDLKKRGFKFVGSVIIYSFLQAVGVVDDHIEDCFRYSK